ncbi:MAG: transglycosylase SLT domain-containing protein [Bradyrhizobium sp.]|uniref:transglycosylase SLT domain-containing protein n=1 Tax=Bradyrhizobium sp. TaxID=376 RepID=UPI00239FB78C|nr:transglycosylase SLT domain-containing protein [Bradyrhizobium sp.]MDE2329806.1 transglycosylase SLT domain-containing protein [Bradyrhizobium sp.]MDE2602525.1 transglycosylase SLT domain-containing protein [Bradyrhizobium sp.]
MKRLPLLAWLAVLAALSLPQAALAQRARYETMIAAHARANLVPEALVHRVIIRESKYQASLLGRGGAIGLMQIKLATARGLGYTGTAEGLRDPDTNLTYGVKYLAGAYRAAGGDHDRAVHYYAAGYYYAAKHQRLEHLKQARSASAGAPPKPLARDEMAANKAAKDASGATPEAASR